MPARGAAACPGGNETILVAEDDDAVRLFTTRVLRDAGFHVLAARDPAEAIALAREHAGKIDLLLSNVIMPEMNGLELAGHLRALQPDLPALFISGYTKSAIPDRNLAAAEVDMLTKPFTVQDLCTRVRNSLDAHAARRQR